MIEWIVAGETHNINDRMSLYLLEHEGLLGIPMHRLAERGVLQNGDTDKGYRLDPRITTLIIGVRGQTPEEFYTNRQHLADIFKPRNDAGTISWKLGGKARYLDCHTVELSEGKRSHLFQKIAVTLKANNPSWYDPTRRTVTFNLGGGSDTMFVPTEVPTGIGASELDVSKSINYVGNVKVFPIIRIEGVIEDPVIIHEQKGWKLDFTGTTIPAGEWLEIDLRYGRKTVVDQNGDRQISLISKDSNIADFAILPDPDLQDGINSISVSGSAVTLNTNIQVSFYNRYIGV